MTAAIASASTTTVTAGEDGLGSYIGFCRDMAATCETGAQHVESTLANMRAPHNGWGPEKTRNLEIAMEQIKSAQNSFLDAQADLERSLNTADVVKADTGVGQRDSLTKI